MTLSTSENQTMTEGAYNDSGIDERLDLFLETLRDIKWLSNTGEPGGDVRTVVSFEAGYDGENTAMLKVWRPHTTATEATARQNLGDAVIDRIFNKISAKIADPLYQGITKHFERAYGPDDEAQLQQTVDEGMYLEIMDTIKRDVCWGGVEWVLQKPAFFSALLEWYRRGRWPCSWDGDYPDGRPVVL